MSDGGAGFTETQARTLAAALDEVIPRREAAAAAAAMPGAGGLVGAGLVDETLRRLPDMRLPIAMGLDAVEKAAMERHGRSFADLLREERRAVLDQVAAADAGLLPTLMFLAYVTYYRDPAVLEGLGLEPRPPHPKGYDMAPHDLGLLDPVRRRGKLYRDC